MALLPKERKAAGIIDELVAQENIILVHAGNRRKFIMKRTTVS